MGSKIRLQHELTELAKEFDGSCTARPVAGNIMHWQAVIHGPAGTPYEGGVFYVSLEFTDDYPFKPPLVSFRTPIYHCNISQEGEICMDILKDRWSPALTVSKLLLSICSVMAQPNPDDPLVLDIADVYKHSRELHDERARLWTLRHAVDHSVSQDYSKGSLDGQVGNEEGSGTVSDVPTRAPSRRQERGRSRERQEHGYHSDSTAAGPQETDDPTRYA